MRSIKVLILIVAISILVYIAYNSYTEGVDFEGGKTFTVGDTTNIDRKTILTPDEQRSIDSFNSGDTIKTALTIKAKLR